MIQLGSCLHTMGRPAFEWLLGEPTANFWKDNYTIASNFTVASNYSNNCTIRYNYSCLNNYRPVRTSMELLRDGQLSCEVSRKKKNRKLQL